MPLPTLQEAKDYLRVSVAAEDSTIGTLQAAALSWAENLVGRPITARAMTFEDLSAHEWGDDGWSLQLPKYPILSTSLTVLDADGDPVDPLDFDIDRARGRLTGLDGYEFAGNPHTVTATVGLTAHPDYAVKYEPSVRAMLLALTAILYNQRNPNASSESESGTSVTYDTAKALPEWLRDIVDSLALRRLA